MPGHFLAAAIRANGLEPARRVRSPDKVTNVSPSSDSPRTWRDIWGCGHGAGAITDIVPAAVRVERRVAACEAARRVLSGD